MILFYYIYNNCKSNRDTVIVVKRVFSLAKTIVVDVIVIYIPRIPVVFFVMGYRTLFLKYMKIKFYTDLKNIFGLQTTNLVLNLVTLLIYVYMH